MYLYDDKDEDDNDQYSAPREGTDDTEVPCLAWE